MPLFRLLGHSSTPAPVDRTRIQLLYRVFTQTNLVFYPSVCAPPSPPSTVMADAFNRDVTRRIAIAIQTQTSFRPPLRHRPPTARVKQDDAFCISCLGVVTETRSPLRPQASLQPRSLHNFGFFPIIPRPPTRMDSICLTFLRYPTSQNAAYKGRRSQERGKRYKESTEGYY